MFGIHIAWRTREGTLVIVDIHDPDATVQVLNEKNEMVVERQPGKDSLTIGVAPGIGRVRLVKGDVELFAREFSLVAGGKETIHVRVEPALSEISNLKSQIPPPPPKTIRPVFVEDFTHDAVFEDTPDSKRGYANGAYYYDFKGLGAGGWNLHSYSDNMAIEISAQVTGSVHSAWLVNLENFTHQHGVQVAVTCGGGVWVRPNVFDRDPSHALHDPSLSLITSEAVRPAGQYNTVRILVKGKTFDFTINGQRLCKPITTDFEFAPGVVALGLDSDGQQPVRIEYRRFRLWQATDLSELPPVEPIEWPPPAVAPFDAKTAKVRQAAWAKHLGVPVEITNSIGMKLVLVPPGEFLMGSGESADEAAAFCKRAYGWDCSPGIFHMEYPQHRVRITRPFYLGACHVARGEFREFIKDLGYKTDAEKDGSGALGRTDSGNFEQKPEYTWRNAGFDQTDEHPVVAVSWNDAAAFCEWLARKEGKKYRLPTEAQWEYACRAGTTTRFCCGDDPEALANFGNVADATLKRRFPACPDAIKASDGYVFTSPVGQFRPNAFGLYDMHGNAWQWCADWYSDYPAAPVDDPVGPAAGPGRICRGCGFWCDGRSAERSYNIPAYRADDVGFRVSLVVAGKLDQPAEAVHKSDAGAKN